MSIMNELSLLGKLAKKDYEDAIKYIEKWEPSKELGYMITGANSQIQFNN